MSQSISFVFLLIVFLHVQCTPTDHQREGKDPRPLSDKPHTNLEGDHSVEYDHEAFLGEKEAGEFDDLPVEESKRRLRKICDKIDSDKDGYLTYEELKKWVEHISHSYTLESVKEYIPEVDDNGDNKISWEEHKDSISFGDDDTLSRATLKHNERKFKFCDQNKDGLLDEEEFMGFLHPEEFEHTQQFHVEETFINMDKNEDGTISLEEYIEDIWPVDERDVDEEEPEWVKSEKETFRDTNGDGKLDMKELTEWLAPEGYNPSEAEASHLIHHADANKDNKLSIDEVIDNHELFVGSQATDYGSYLKRHDEF